MFPTSRVARAFVSAAAMLLNSFLPPNPEAVPGMPRPRRPNRGQRWFPTSHVEAYAYHRQPPHKGPKPNEERTQVPVRRMAYHDGSRYPRPNKLINTPKHLRRATA